MPTVAGVVQREELGPALKFEAHALCGRSPQAELNAARVLQLGTKGFPMYTRDTVLGHALFT